MIFVLCILDNTYRMYIYQHTRTQLWGVAKASDKGDTNPRNHMRDIKEKTLWVYEEREPFVLRITNPSSLFHFLHCIDWDIVNTFLTHKHKPCEWEKALRNLRSHIQIQSLLVVFPLVLQWRVSGKLGRKGTWRSWLIASLEGSSTYRLLGLEGS